MKALQTYYTSCRHGLSGRAGYQIQALTPGIEAGEELDIADRSFYRLPNDTSPEPDAEALAALPRDFRFGRFSSGRAALTLTTYVGRDYSGRWGNFFSHTLVFSEDPRQWPIDFYEWEGWKSCLEESEDEDSESRPLPIADLGEETTTESFTLRELSSFLKEQPGRMECFEAMLRAVFAGRREKRPLVIRDTQTEGLYWLACIQKAFPRPHAFGLSFSSYQFDTHQCSDLNLTTSGTAFTFDRQELEFQFYGFDITAARRSEVAEEGVGFSTLAARWMAEDPRCLERFHNFMEHFDHHDIDHGLTLASQLFEFLEGRSKRLATQCMNEVLGFVERCAGTQGLGRILELCHQANRNDLEVAAESRLLSFLIHCARETKQTKHWHLTTEVWWDFFIRRAWNGGEGLQAARDGLRGLERDWERGPGELEKRLLQLCVPSSAHLAAIQVQGAVILFLLRLTVHSLLALDTPRVGSQPQVSRLLEALRDRDPGPEILRQMLDIRTSGDPDILADFCIFFADSRHQLGRLLAERLARLPENSISRVRAHLANSQCQSLLHAEALATIEQSADPVEALETYRRLVREIPALWNRLAGALVDNISMRNPGSRTLRWLHDGFLEELPRPVASKLANIISQQISIDPERPKFERHAHQLAILATRRDLKLMPDRPSLRDLLVRIRDGQQIFDAHHRRLLLHAQALNEEEYKLFCSELLPAVLATVVDAAEHGEVVQNLAGGGKIMLLEPMYLGWLRQKRKEPWSEDRQAALEYWLGWNRAAASHLESLREEALGVLSSRLCRLHKSLWAELDERLHQTPSAQRAWWALREDVERRRKRGLGWLFR